MKGSRADYFCDLVAFNQAVSSAERERWYLRLRGYPRYRKVFRLDAMHAAYHSEWYIPAIRELARCREFRADPKWVGDDPALKHRARVGRSRPSGQPGPVAVP